MQPGVCLGHPDDALDVPDADRHPSSVQRFLPQIFVKLGYLVDVDVVKPWIMELLGVNDVLSQ